ncbi:hypothetical protein [Priestia megaterium]|nr:hypothetical protein [Priestia megaterium]MDY0943981.1 hypothetical protein [Priestia megaterium]
MGRSESRYSEKGQESRKLYNWTDTVVFTDNDRLERAPTSHGSSTRK